MNGAGVLNLSIADIVILFTNYKSFILSGFNNSVYTFEGT